MHQLTLITNGGYTIHCPEKEIIALGRRDIANHQQIDIDFAELGEHGVSRLHALLILDDDAVYIQDLNSRNGTYRNQQLIHPLKNYPLQAGDTITLGRIDLTIQIDTQA